MRLASRECNLAARYLDLLGSVIDRELGPRRWPRILVLDAKPFGPRAYGAAEHGETWDGADRAGSTLVAVGGGEPGRRLTACGSASPATRRPSPGRTFSPSSLGEPTWVVADGSPAIRAAVRRRWPKATFYACEFHLGRALRESALRDGIWPDDPAHGTLFERAFWSEADWNVVANFALDQNAPNLLSWVLTNDSLVRRQAKLRHRFTGFPRSNGAAEAICDWIDRRFGRRRRYSLRNAKRLSLVFGLLRAELAGQADPVRYGAIVKRECAALPTRFEIDWTALTDPRSGPCSIAKLLLAARDRGRRDTAAYMACAKTRSVLRLLATENEARAAAAWPRSWPR